MATPTFSSLFKRGRYHRERIEDLRQEQRKELERFCVAAVGFTLKHDADFLQSFQKAIGYQEKSPLSIQVEPHDESDLLLQPLDGGIPCIVEFKVFAKLENKQNPLRCDFWSADGYGTILKKRRGFDRFQYAVICRECEIKRRKWNLMSFSKPTTRGIPYRFVSWSELSKRVEVNSPLVDDLFVSLANHGIDEVNGFMTRSKRIRSGIEETVTALNILKNVLKEHQVEVDEGDLVQSTPGDVEWSFGYDVSPEAAKENDHLSSIANRKSPQLEEIFLWLGYGSFGSTKVAPQIHCYWASKFEDFAQRFQPDHSVVTVRPDGKTLNIILTPSAKSKLSDQEWFGKALQFLAVEANKTSSRRH